MEPEPIKRSSKADSNPDPLLLKSKVLPPELTGELLNLWINTIYSFLRR